jgi:hypothetical protein
MTMTQPYYTATAGPADPNAGFRAKLYGGLALLSGVVTFLQAVHIIDAGQASSISGLLSAVTTLLGAFGFGLAAVKTNSQVSNGTFDAAPPPPPVLTAADSIQVLGQQLQDVVTASVQKVTEGLATVHAAAGAISAVPGVVLPGPVGDLIQAMHDRGTRAP